MTEAPTIAAYLEFAAAEKRLVTYGELVNAFPDLPKSLVPWPSHPLCRMFDQLDQEDAKNDLPFRTAIVVGQKTGTPGKGFFTMFKRLRRKSLLRSEHHAFWSGEVRDLFAHYSPR